MGIVISGGQGKKRRNLSNQMILKISNGLVPVEVKLQLSFEKHKLNQSSKKILVE